MGISNAVKRIVDDAVKEGKFIELHEKRKVTDDGKCFDMPVMVCVSDIVSVEMSDAMTTGCYLSLRGRKRALHITENYQDVRLKIHSALDNQKKHEAEKQIKPYRVDRTVKYRGVHVVVVERATQEWYGLLSANFDEDNWLCVKMRRWGDTLYPWVGSQIVEIPLGLVEN